MNKNRLAITAAVIGAIAGWVNYIQEGYHRYPSDLWIEVFVFAVIAAGGVYAAIYIVPVAFSVLVRCGTAWIRWVSEPGNKRRE